MLLILGDNAVTINDGMCLKSQQNINIYIKICGKHNFQENFRVKLIKLACEHKYNYIDEQTSTYISVNYICTYIHTI